jgi:hypothetical protein
MKEKTLFQCEICDTQYQLRELALSCEASGVPPKRVNVSDVVKLKNRNVGYTLAIVKALRVVQGPATYIPDLPSMTQEQYQKIPHWWDDKTINPTPQRHEWELILDRKVCLDHKWETSSDTLSEHYVLTEEQAKDMKREDNNCW